MLGDQEKGTTLTVIKLNQRKKYKVNTKFTDLKDLFVGNNNGNESRVQEHSCFQGWPRPCGAKYSRLDQVKFVEDSL